MNTFSALIALVILTALNAFFAMSEIAIITLNDNKIKKLAEDGHKAAKRIARLISDMSRFLATIQVGVTFAGFLSSAFAANSFTSDFSELLAKLPVVGRIAEPLATVLITLLLSFFNLVFGELVPKKIAMQRAEKISYAVSGVLIFVGTVFKPFVWLLSKATDGVTRLLGFDPNAEEETMTEEEIMMMVDVGGEKGVIEESEREMIANIFEFGDTTASEVMTHRTEVIAAEDTDTVDDIVKLAMSEGKSRIPIYHEDLDNIRGIVYVKDLLQFVGDVGGSRIKAAEIMRTPHCVPETMRLDNLFGEMTEHKVQMAIVIDEYGGTAGIITMEDIIESILGNIQDEYDHEDEDISQVSETRFDVDGTTPIDEVSDLIGVELPEGDYDTIAGFVVTALEYIPKQGEHPVVTVGRATLTVEDVEDRRISRILIDVERGDSQPEI